MMNHKPPTAAQLKKAVDQFNAHITVGAPVIVQMDSGEKRATKTRSEAYVLSGHSPVVFLDGISGCYHIDRVSLDSQPEN